MEGNSNEGMFETTANRLGLVCRTKNELYYFLTTSCTAFAYCWSACANATQSWTGGASFRCPRHSWPDGARTHLPRRQCVPPSAEDDRHLFPKADHHWKEAGTIRLHAPEASAELRAVSYPLVARDTRHSQEVLRAPLPRAWSGRVPCVLSRSP